MRFLEATLSEKTFVNSTPALNARIQSILPLKGYLLQKALQLVSYKQSFKGGETCIPARACITFFNYGACIQSTQEGNHTA